MCDHLLVLVERTLCIDSLVAHGLGDPLTSTSSSKVHGHA